MMEVKIRFLNKLPNTVEKKMQAGFIEYEASHGVDVNYKPFSIVLSDQQDNVLGVINAYTAFAEVYVNDIWVDKAHRGKGHGKRLLQALEEHFKGKGFNNINLVTSAFQAPAFYEKCGFTLEFVRANRKNPQFTKFFFIKYFDDEEQAQGLLKK